jgi:ATP-binding cassette subfamily B (MDR/TAP) protein 1
MTEAHGKTSGTRTSSTPDPDPDAGSDSVRTHGTRPDLPPGPDSGTAKVSYLELYRYADIWDLVVVATSALCAIAAGAALPLLSV